MLQPQAYRACKEKRQDSRKDYSSVTTIFKDTETDKANDRNFKSLLKKMIDDIKNKTSKQINSHQEYKQIIQNHQREGERKITSLAEKYGKVIEVGEEMLEGGK